MTMMSDLSKGLVEEILSRVPITSLRAVRSTCKQWNCLTNDPSFTKKQCDKAAKDLLVIMLNDFKVCLMSVNLHGIQNRKDVVDPSIKRIGELNQVKISNVFYCDGLLLCHSHTKEKEGNTTRLVVWNPYLGQTSWIEPRIPYRRSDMFGIGFDKNNNYKILRVFFEFGYNVEYEIYDFKSNSWRVLTISSTIVLYKRGVSLKGNTYFFAQERIKVEEVDKECVLLCFDFTRERFGPALHLPFHCDVRYDDIVLSSVREEKLAVLFQRLDTEKMEIWITTKIEPNAVSWNKFLAVNTKTITGFEFEVEPRSFFVDEEKKVAVICDIHRFKPTKTGLYKTACIIGEDGYLKEVDLGEAVNVEESPYSCPLVCSYYVPRLFFEQE
ncbi:F-box associated domain type 1 [Arabidopsis suecica]|uniref:F-box associated domain type 1 n=1 Tax=Arabidopsis suecica TaxID=45249 RepID=A0A8T2BQC6_ARASU|nr:F-box associated domain type 1 [Arabidopsis suecica]